MKKIKLLLTILGIWAFIGLTLRYIYSEPPTRRYSDVVMAEVFVKDHPELDATWRQLDDGSIKIKPKKGQPFYLKYGVITSFDN